MQILKAVEISVSTYVLQGENNRRERQHVKKHVHSWRLEHTIGEIQIRTHPRLYVRQVIDPARR